MLNWWYSFLAQNPIAYATDILGWIQSFASALVSMLDQQTMQQNDAWTGNFQSFSNWRDANNRMHQAIRAKMQWLYTYAYLGMGRWVSQRLLAQAKWSAYWHDHLWKFTDWVANRIYRMIDDMRAWVLRDIYKPLDARLHDLYDKVMLWAYQSYQDLTTPKKLGALAFWPVVQVFMDNPFAIGKIIGDWLAKLVYANTVRTIQLAESIITDVL